MSDESQDDSQKTEEPTAKKLEDARKKGQVALSREVNNFIMLLAATILMGAIFGSVFSKLFENMRTYLEHAGSVSVLPTNLSFILGDAFKDTFSVMFLPFVVLLFAAFIGPFAQVGPLFAPESIKPDWGKISLIKGWQRLFSMRSIVEFIKGLLKLFTIGLVGTLLLMPFFGALEHMITLEVAEILPETKSLIMRMMSGILIVLLIIAVADLLYQRFENYKKMRMTKQEIKDEYRQTEGDPHVKAKLKQLRMQRARQRMMQAVPEADVVITNPTHYSVALKYDAEKSGGAPTVIAKGVDELALRIREVATENDVILYPDPPLARSLYDTVELDEPIPLEMYKAVAEVISFVYKKRGVKRR
ncbi:MAG: flagellar biosynthesis protein FlhB [Pseudobdellovibrionaceae bacterium]